MNSAGATFCKCQSGRRRPPRLSYRTGNYTRFPKRLAAGWPLITLCHRAVRRRDRFQTDRRGGVLDKLRIGYPSSAVSTLPFDIAKEKGFYTKAGLDVEYIQMRSAFGPQAILNGNIQFFTSPQSAINAAVAGLPLVVVLSLYRDTPWVLVTNKESTKPRTWPASGLPSRTSALHPTTSPAPD